MYKLFFLGAGMLLTLVFFGCNRSNPEKEATGPMKERNIQERSTPAQTFSMTDFFRAATEGNLPAVKKAVQSGLDVNTTNENGSTALMLAAFDGHIEVVDYLIKQGADVNVKDQNGRTALIYSASGDNPETVRLLIDEGAEIDHADNVEGFTALMFAAAEGQKEVVENLLEAGANKTLKDKDGDTPRDFALDNGHREVAGMLAD